MKRILPFITALFITVAGYSQTVDSASINPSYTSQTYYSFANGVIKTSLSDWDFAIGIGPQNIAIRTNDGFGVKLYSYPNGDISDWATVDTTGLYNWNYTVNDENDWDQGAFNYGGAGYPDFGWGVYNDVTHNVIGDSIYIIETKGSQFKKLRIDGMFANGSFEFTYADLDGSNEVSAAIMKTNYNGKNFVYYSIDNDSVMDLEPMATEWDIVFNKYRAVQPSGGYYNVTGVQTNRNRTTAEARGVDLTTVDWNTQSFEDKIGTMGWDWKSIGPPTWSWEIEDSLTYFVADTNNNVWQITFTDFGGSGNGTFYFNKQRVAGVSTQDFTVASNDVNVFPNPVSENLTISIKNAIQSNVEVTIFTITGNVVYTTKTNVLNNTQLVVPVSEWQKGIYLVRVGSGNDTAIKKFIVQ